MHLDSITLHQNSKPIVHLDAFAELPEALRLLGFRKKQPSIVIVGGAGGMTADDIAKVQSFFELHLLLFAKQKNVVVLDGGTDNGVMAAIGRAREQANANIPLIGVLAGGIKNVESMLEPHHSHFIFCPGSNWGDEAEWIAAAASVLSDSQSTIALLINGGQIAWEDARLNIQYGRPVLIAEGSGRTADMIANTSTGLSFEPKAMSLIRTGKVHVANFFKNPEQFIRKMDELMK